MSDTKKPLEPPAGHYGHEPGEWFYGCDACCEVGGADLHPKRLTDAELAAETWRAAYRCWLRWPASEDQEHVETLERFATLPHYDEEQA